MLKEKQKQTDKLKQISLGFEIAEDDDKVYSIQTIQKYYRG
jgi:hypothetical protein